MKCGCKSVKKNGSVSGKQKFKCNSCAYQWCERRGKKVNYQRHYHEWLFGRRTLAEIAEKLAVSYPTLIKEFDTIYVAEGVQCAAPGDAVNLLIDATFFGREYGYLCFHDTRRIIYFREIKTETMADLRRGLREVTEAGFRIKSVTIDGRRGYRNNIRKMLGNIPIQMCLFHQKPILRRYLTDNPKSACGKDLKALAAQLCHMEAQAFVERFYGLAESYRGFLRERNQNGGFRHVALRAAFRSLEGNLPLIFTYQDIPDANIPSTTNRLEGAFSHLKEKIAIHRGLSKARKKKAAKFILKNS